MHIFMILLLKINHNKEFLLPWVSSAHQSDTVTGQVSASICISEHSVKHGHSGPARILQLLQGLVVDGAHAVVDKGAAQKHNQGKDPRVILRVNLEDT